MSIGSDDALAVFIDATDGWFARAVRVRERLLSRPNLDLYSPFLSTEPLAVTRRGVQLIHSLDVALAQELRRQLMALRRAGKFVECYLETAGEGSTYPGRVGSGGFLQARMAGIRLL